MGNTRPAYLAGSLPWQWLMGTSTDYPPIVAPIGGETSYDPWRGWTAHIRVHWIQNLSPPGIQARWQDLQQIKMTVKTETVPWWWKFTPLPQPKPKRVGERTPERDLTWGEVADGAGYRFAGSVTWGDMRNVPPDGTQIVDHL